MNFLLALLLLLPAIPGAQGFGSATVHGSGRSTTPAVTTLCKVTTTADSGAGSLRQCLTDQAGPMVVVFETSGRISLLSALDLNNQYLWIAGETAPSPGIMLTGCTVRVRNSDIALTHFQIRPGDSLTPATGACAPDQRDGLQFYADIHNVQRVFVHHLTVSWAIDENFGFNTGSNAMSDITVSYTMGYEGLTNSIHDGGAQAHGFGVLIGDDITNITWYRSLLAHHLDRSLRFNGDGNTAETVNMVVYDWGGTTHTNSFNIADNDGTGLTPMFHNFVKNYYKVGPAYGGSNFHNFGAPAGQVATTTKIYAPGNIGPNRATDTGDDWLVIDTSGGISEANNRSNTPAFTGSGVTEMTAAAAYEEVLNFAGARPVERMARDTIVIGHVRNGTGGLVDCIGATHPITAAACPANVGGWPTMATNTRTFTAVASPNDDSDADGYTNLEEQIHQYSVQLELTAKAASAKAKRKDRRFH